MKKYSKNELLDLIDNFDALKIEVQKTMGEILNEMYQCDILVPLSFYSDVKNRSPIGIAIAHVYKDKYSNIEYEQFLEDLNNTKPLDLTKNIYKTQNHFISEFIKFPKVSIVEDEILRPITVNDYFNLIDRALNIFKLEDVVLNKEIALEIIQTILEETNLSSLLDYSKNDLNRLNSTFLSIDYANSDTRYQKIFFPSLLKINDIIVEMYLPENLVLDELTNDIKINLSMDFLMNLISDEKYHNFIKDCLEIKHKNKVGFLSKNIDVEKLTVLNIEKDSSLMKYILHYYFVTRATNINTRERYENSFIKDIYSLDELEKTYPSLQKGFLEFNNNELWSDEMLQTMMKLAKVGQNKSIGFDVSSFCDYFEELEFREILQNKDIIPEVFLEKFYQSCKVQGIELFFDHSKFYVSDVSIIVRNLSLQLLPFYLKKLNEGEEINKNIEPLDRLQFVSTLFKNIKRSNKYNDFNEIETKNYYKIILEIENGIYQYSLSVFEQLQNEPLGLERTTKIKDFIKSFNSEIRIILTSSLIQKIKNPNLLWVIKELEGISRGDYILNEPIQNYIDMGFSKQQLVAHITDLYPDMEKEVADMDREKRQVVIDYVERQDLTRLAISKISKNNKEINDSKKLWSNFIDLKNKVLGSDNPKFNNDSIYSTYYIENNLTKNLIEHLNKYHSEYLEQWYKDKKGFIESKKIEKLMDIELKLNNNQLREFLHKVIRRVPSLYIHLKNHLFIQNNSEIYQKLFNINYDVILKNILDAKDTTDKDSFIENMSHDYIVKNFNLVLEQDSLSNFNYLVKKMKIDDLIDGFNNCDYLLQRKVFLDLDNGFDFYLLATKNSSSVKTLLFNNKTTEDFCEAVVFLREIKRKKFIKFNLNNSEEKLSYFEFKEFWEHYQVLKHLRMNDDSDTLDFIVKEFPLSMYKKSDSAYLTNLSAKQFVQIIENVNKILDNENGLEIYNKINTGNYFYHLCFNKIDHSDLYSIESKVLKLLDTMNSLKNKPFHYMSLFNELQHNIGEKLEIIYDDFTSEWKIIPNDCPFLKEFQSMLKLDNNPKYSNWSKSEYFSHHFFNIFVDKDIYFRGMSEYLYKISIDDMNFSNQRNIKINNKITFPFLYENYAEKYEEVNYYTESKKIELKNKFIDNLPSFYFNNSTFFNLETLKKSESKDIFLEKICDEITSDNIWMILTTFGMTEKEYGRLSNAQSAKILQTILENPNITIEVLKKFEIIYKIMKECSLLSSNRPEYLRQEEIDYIRSMENRYFKMSSLEINELEIIVNEKMMSLEVAKNNMTEKIKVKKF